MVSHIYINGVGAYLPGPCIDNEGMESYLGPLDARQRRIGKKALRQNGIRGRHYALAQDGTPRHTNAEMAAIAGRRAIAASELTADHVEYVAAAASQGDLMAPGFASMVHGELGIGPAEIASLSSFCASGMMAIKSAHDAIRAGGRRNAVVCASEFASRFLRAGYINGTPTPTDTEFLRWMLSDGAGAVVLEDRPNDQGLSLRIDWIDLVSYADRFDTCMYAGTDALADGVPRLPWSNHRSLHDAFDAGAFLLRQDLKLLDKLVPIGMSRYFELIDQGRLRPDEIDWALYHFSSDVFRHKLIAHAEKAGAPINQNKIFTNLFEKGNTGSAAIFIMLEELIASGRAEPGQKILCMVPESGRFVISFMELTVVGQNRPAAHAAECPSAPTTAAVSLRKNGNAAPVDAPAAKLVRQLTQVWVDFEAGLNTVPIVDKLNRGRLRLDDYRELLLNMRQQVIDGSRWIARAASNLTGDAADLRSMFIAHARDEHLDYQMLERDYVACGGSLDDIVNAEKNIGSEALSAWMFQRASRENPLDLLGAMFIIEGLGNRLAATWAQAIKTQLGLTDNEVTFLRYHGVNDESHLEKLWEAIDRLDPSTELARTIVKTAKVTARLYRLQLEELGNR